MFRSGTASPSPPDVALSFRLPQKAPQSYLTPFADFSNIHLRNFTAEQAAQFAVEYTVGHIRSSAYVACLCGAYKTEVDTLANKINRLRDEAWKASAPAEGYSIDCLIANTTLAATERVGNCQEFSLVALRALKEFGYPHNVTLMLADGKMNNGSIVSHGFIRIQDSAGGNYWFADPMFGMLNEQQRLELTGNSDCQAFFPENTSQQYAHICAQPTDGRFRLYTKGELSAHPNVRIAPTFDLISIEGELAIRVP